MALKTGKLSKAQLSRLLKGSKVVKLTLSGKSARAKEADYAKWAKSAKRDVKVARS